MDGEPHVTHEAQSDNLSNEDQEVIVCPNCKGEGPRGIFCNNCGYPLYMEYSEKSEPGEAVYAPAEIGSEAVEPEAPVEAIVEPDAPLMEQDVGLHEELASEELKEGVKAEPAEDLTFLNSVRARAHNLVRRYRGYKEDPAHEDEQDEQPPDVPLPEGEVEDLVLDLHEELEGDMIERDTYNIDTETPDTVESDETVEPRGRTPGSTQAFDQDPILRDVMGSLVKSISMGLWLLERLVEEEIDGKDFNELFEEYSSRTEAFINNREELLKGARNTSSMEKAFTQARLKLEELEMRRDIGYISEEEYRAKAPGFEWDVEKYGEEISRRQAEAAFLEDLANIISVEEIGRMKDRAENLRGGLADLEESHKISPETADTAKESLDRIQDCLDISGRRENYI